LGIQVSLAFELHFCRLLEDVFSLKPSSNSQDLGVIQRCSANGLTNTFEMFLRKQHEKIKERFYAISPLRREKERILRSTGSSTHIILGKLA